MPAGPRFNVLQLPFRELPAGEIALRTLRPAEQALIEYEIRLAPGLDLATARSATSPARCAGSRRAFPTIRSRSRLLTEVERLAGNRDAAEAAAERWAAAAPNDGRALMYQGLLRIDALRAAGIDRPGGLERGAPAAGSREPADAERSADPRSLL